MQIISIISLIILIHWKFKRFTFNKYFKIDRNKVDDYKIQRLNRKMSHNHFK